MESPHNSQTQTCDCMCVCVCESVRERERERESNITTMWFENTLLRHINIVL